MEFGRRNILLMGMLGALGCLLLGQIMHLVPERPKTAEATLYQSQEPIWVQGVVIRREYPLYAPQQGSWLCQVQDGAKVAAGQTVVRWETGRSLGEEALSLHLLQRGAQAAEEPLYTRRMALREYIRQLAAARGTGRISAAQEVAGLVLGESQDVSRRLSEREEALEMQSGGFHQSISAPESGIFVSWTDGLEERLTPEDPWGGWSLPLKPLPGETVGRLVLGDTWYFRGKVPMALEPGDRLEAQLPVNAAPVTLTVQAVRDDWVLFSCQACMAEAAQTRTMTVKILPEPKTGVEIPAEAVYTVGEETGVWRLVGEAVQFQPVTILRETEGQAVAALEPSGEGLRPGDQVLLDHR